MQNVLNVESTKAGSLRNIDRTWGTKDVPRRRRNRDFRAVHRINVLPALGWIAVMALTLFLASPIGMSIFAAVWGTP